MRRVRLTAVAATVLVAWATTPAPAMAQDDHEGHGDHSAHTAAGLYTPERSVARYVIPRVTLVNQDRVEVQLDELLASDRPLLLNFMFATCTTVCPILSAGFSNLQRVLGDEASQVPLISITIDPDNDTPEVMKSYLKRCHARPGWQFLTGHRADIEQVMHAFEAFVPDKMSHRPLTFLRSPKDGQWVRIDGFISTADLVKEYRALAVN